MLEKKNQWKKRTFNWIFTEILLFSNFLTNFNFSRSYQRTYLSTAFPDDSVSIYRVFYISVLHVDKLQASSLSSAVREISVEILFNIQVWNEIQKSHITNRELPFEKQSNTITVEQNHIKSLWMLKIHILYSGKHLHFALKLWTCDEDIIFYRQFNSRNVKFKSTVTLTFSA